MPTFATNTFADQTTPAASEAWTINSGAVVTVVGDYINAASPNPFTGVNTVNEGRLLIDGRLVWEIGVANTTNATTGLSVTGGTSGATAVITRVGTGLIKFRYTNNSVFQNGETIAGGSFSAAANTAPSRSTLIYGINAATNGLSVARLGNLEVRGVWRQLGTLTGTTNQTISSWTSAVHAGVWVQNGGNATLTNASNQIALTHEWAIGQVVEFATSGSLSGTGFSTGTKYYVVASDWSGLTGQFGTYVSLSATRTGSAIAATGTGTGTISLLASGAIVTFSNGSPTITAPSGHNRSNGDSLTLSTSGSLSGTGFDDINTYWVINSDVTAGTFQLCSDYSPATGTGTPIAATGTGSGTHQIVPDDNYLIWQNIVDRTLTGATAAVGIDLNHGRFFKQTSGSTTITFGDEGAAAAVTFSTTSGSSTITTSAIHNQVAGNVVRMSNPPTPFTANTDYYVLTAPTTTTLTLGTLVNGSAITATQNQTNTATLLPQLGGKIPAYGARIRVPNVAVVSTNSGNAPTPIITSFVTVANSVGTFLLDKTITAGLQFNSNNINGFTGRFLTVHNLLTIVYALNATILQDVAVSTLAADTSGGINLLSQVFYLQNVFPAGNTSVTGLVLTNCLQGSVKGGQSTNFARSNSAHATISCSGLSNALFQSLRYFGAQFSLANSTNVNVLNCAHSDSILRGAFAAFNQNSFLNTANVNTSIDQLFVSAAPRTAVFTTPSSSSIFRRIGTSTNPIDLLGSAGAFIVFTTIDSFSLVDCFWKNTSGTQFTFQTNAVLSNIKIFNSGDYGKQLSLGARLKNIRLKGIRASSFTSTTEGSGLHFYDLFTSATAGLVGLIFYPKNTDDYYSNLSYTIDADTNPTSTYFINGALQLRTSGNQITYTTPFIQGHTALGSLTVTSNNNANYTFSYDLDTGSGFSGSFTTIASGSSLGATIATPSTGFRIRIRILATVTAAANSITALTIATTSTANAQAAIAYPYLQSTQTINGLVAGSVVGLFDGSGNLIQSGTATAGSFTFNPIEYFTSSNYTIKYRRYGYKEGSIVVALSNGTTTNTVAQVVDSFRVLSSSAVAALTGLSLTGTDYTQTVTHSLSELYDYSQYVASLLANIGNPYAVSTANGTDLQLTVNYTRTACALTGTGSLSLPTKTATITGDTSSGQLPVTDSSGLRFRVYGLPGSAGAVMRSKRISTSTITNPTITSNGEAYFTIALGENYQLRADAIGYMASGFITINSNTATSVQITLSQFVDANGTPIYGQGVAGEKALISFNPSTLVISIAYSGAYPTISLFSAFDRIEELLATSTAIEFTAHPVYSNGTILFPRDIVTNAANPARIQAASGNTGTPTFTFEVVDQANLTPYGLFDFSNGKFINYPTTVNIASGGTALTQQQVRDAAALALTTGLTPATGSIDSKITAIPTNPVLATDTRLNNLDAAVSSRSTYTGADTAGTTTLLSRITSTRAGNLDNLDATISSRSTYAGGDTSGTTTLLGRLTSTRSGYLDNLTNLDASVAARPTLTQIEGSTVLFKVSNYTAPDNTTIATIGTRTARVDALITNPGSGDRFTVTALSNAPTGSGGGGSGLDAAGVRAAIGLASANLDSQLANLSSSIGAIPTTVYTSTLSTILSAVNAIPTTPAPSVSQIWTGFTSGTIAPNIVSQIGFTSTDRTTLSNIPTATYTTSLSNLLAAVQSIPTNPLLTTDTRLNYLNASIAAIPTIAPPTATSIRQEIDSNSVKLAGIGSVALDLWRFAGYDPDYPLTTNTTANTITVNGETVTVTGDETGQTYTRTGSGASTLALRQNNFEANYRNLNDTQNAVSSRSLLKIDGLKTQGAFNTFGYEVWDVAASAIKPRNTTQVFICRVILEVTPSTAGSLLTLDVDIGSSTPLLVHSEQMVLSIFAKTTITRSFLLYASQTFVTNGGKVYVTATDPVSITNASIFIYLLGGTL